MGVYDRQVASALRIIKAKGERITWTEPPVAETDNETPWETTDDGQPVVNEASIAFFPLSRQYSELFRYLKGSEVVIGHLYGLMGAEAFVPTLKGVITRGDGTKLSVVSIDPLAPNGEVILYTIEFAK